MRSLKYSIESHCKKNYPIIAVVEKEIMVIIWKNLSFGGGGSHFLPVYHHLHQDEQKQDLRRIMDLKKV